MKIQHKLTIYILSTTILLLVALSFLFYWNYKDIALDNAKKSMETAAIVGADQLGTLLIEKSKIAIDMTISDTLVSELGISNAKYAALSDKERKLRIDKLNSRWMKMSSPEHPLVRAFTQNSVASLLRKKQQILAGEIGEIFLTNRYGLVVGATNKLTTVAHSHKYWWRATYNDSQGRIFFDDRGYDESVQGYVIGIVVPVKQNNKIIGILKCNFNLLGPLSDFLDDFSRRIGSKTVLTRSGGLVVLGNDAPPLSMKLPDVIQKTLTKGVAGSAFMNTKVGEQLVAYSPVSLTYGSDVYGFGGNYKSADHITGNAGGGWFILVTKGIASVMSPVVESARWLISVGTIFLLLIGAAAYLLGKKAAQPIMALTERVERIGQGHIDEPIKINSYDEMGILGQAFNKMTKKLKETTVSRDSLEELVEERTKELKDVHNKLIQKERLATLGQLTATVSHELRNPLGAMRPSLYVIDKKSDKQDKHVQKAIERVDRNIDRCDHIIDELLDFTRIVEPNKQTIRVDEWLESVIDDQIIPKGIRLEKDLSLENIELPIDIERLRRAVINVMENACHAMMDNNQKIINKDKSYLIIKTIGNEERMEIIITDTGSGIPKDVLDKVFEPLFSTKGFGVGLGMPTVKQIMKQHGGGIEIYSEVGKGTTVTLWLPHKKSEEVAA